MNVGIIDADLIGRKRHRFPNLACMKISGYNKSNGNYVELLTSYDELEKYDKVYVSKVFTDTPYDEKILTMDNVEYGGTGFFYDKADPLPHEIEHHMPDYDLYNDFINNEILRGINKKEFDEYLKYSIGFTTRGCFRKCKFCVNRSFNKVEIHSPINEFLDNKRPYICLLDDNIFGYKDCDEIFKQLKETGKRFKYKQGLDERLLNKDKCEMLLNSKYIGDITFAFDNIRDRKIIEEKLKLFRSLNSNKTLKFYVLCGFDENNIYDEEFWIRDIIDTFERIKILMSYNCIPYIMRYEKYKDSPYRGIYI